MVCLDDHHSGLIMTMIDPERLELEFAAAGLPADMWSFGGCRQQSYEPLC